MLGQWPTLLQAPQNWWYSSLKFNLLSLGITGSGLRVAQFVRIGLLPSHCPFMLLMACSASCAHTHTHTQSVTSYVNWNNLYIFSLICCFACIDKYGTLSCMHTYYMFHTHTHWGQQPTHKHIHTGYIYCSRHTHTHTSTHTHTISCQRIPLSVSHICLILQPSLKPLSLPYHLFNEYIM